MTEPLKPPGTSDNPSVGVSLRSSLGTSTSDESAQWTPEPTGEPAKRKLVQRIRAAVLDASERARAPLSMREQNFFLLLSVKTLEAKRWQ